MLQNVSTPSFTASGDIAPSRFVKITGAFKVGQCTVAKERSVGVSQEGLVDTPIPGASSTLAAQAGRHVGVFGPGETCLVQVGAAVTAGALLTGDANAKAIPTTTAGDIYHGIALEDQATVDGKVLIWLQGGKV